MRRPRPTLADYMVIAISPVLIMVLIGSLAFFLLEVFYSGPHGVRLQFITAMFVMAAVLVARISIEEGRDYAILFAAPLGLVTIVAGLRFVQFQGPLASISALLNIGLVLLILWAADRLTWDCTVLDESEEAEGAGLMQAVHLEPGADIEFEEDPGSAVEQPRPTSPPTSFWERYKAARRRPHAHGVWVIYFSLAAIPLFGLGQWMIDSGDLASRRQAFQYLITYVASALGLLATTSFLGLRRYLRQRNVPMPADIAASWLGAAACLIIALLVLCLVLPRPAPEYSLLDMPFRVSSPKNLRPSRWGFGRDGPQTQDATRPGERPAEREDVKQGPKTTSSDKQKAPGGSEQGKKGASQSGGRQATGDSDKPNAGKKSDSSGSGEKGKGSSEKGKSESSQDEGSGERGKSESSQGKGSGEQSESESSQGEGESDDQSSSGEDAHQAKDQRPPNGESGEGSERQSPSDGEAEGERRESPSDESNGENESKRRSGAGQSFASRASQLLSSLPRIAGGLTKFLYWVAVIVVVAVLVWRFRNELGNAFSQWWQSLMALWQQLFGGRVQEVEQTVEPERETPRYLPFSAYHDPFVSGRAERQTTEQLVKYTFEAFEAWARERGCARGEEETPSEFAHNAVRRFRELGKDPLQLADLYNIAAYGNARVPEGSRNVLRRFWNRLDQTVSAITTQ